MTVQKCIAKTAGALWAGVEFARECRYGNTWDLAAGAVRPVSVGIHNCNKPCSGDSETLCGSNNLLSLYEKV